MYGQKMLEFAVFFSPFAQLLLELSHKKCERSFLGHPFLNSAALVALNKGMALS